MVIAIALTFFLYYKFKGLDESSKGLKRVLYFLRFLPLLGIGLLLLGPLLQQLIEETKKPVVVLLSDDSQSIGQWSAGTTADPTEAVEQMAVSLSEKYEVVHYAFGEGISLMKEDTSRYDQSITDISETLEYISDIYEGENLGAIVLSTDGIYNQGSNPIYAGLRADIPIYSVALGDTTKVRDVSLEDILHNEVAYLKDEMITQIDIKGSNALGRTIRLTVQKETNGGYQTLDTRQIRIDQESFFISEDVTLSFEEAGIQHYRYSLSYVDGEVNRANNTKDIYIEVLDARQVVKILADAPHPDLSAIKQILEQNKNYEVEIKINDFNATDVNEADVIIFHNLPSRRRSLDNINRTLAGRSVARLYIVGQETNLGKFNSFQNTINIRSNGGNANNAQGTLEERFDLFTISDELKNKIEGYPPLASTYGEYDVSDKAEVLLYQRIGDINTEFPLLAYSDDNGQKTAFLLANDIWRWKLYDHLQHDNFDIVSELLEKSITYIGTKEDKRKFRVNSSANVYRVNDDVRFRAELYNNNYELINEPEVRLELNSSSNDKYDYTFSVEDQSYTLDIGRLAAGSYTYRASTTWSGEPYIDEGRFVVRDIQLELYDQEAQHELLYSLAERTQGAVYYPAQVTQLGQELLNSDKIKPVIYQNTITKPLLDNKWILLFIIVPLILEWALRRYYGSL